MAKKAPETGKSLVIVESPAKARTISKYLGRDFLVESSIGHIRDLPSTAAEIPAEYKGEPWARLGVNVDEEFKPLYIVPASKKAQVTKLRAQLKKVDTLYLATDEDREGEAIAWHLVEVLKPKCPVKRMVFDEITKATINRAVSETRDVDQRLVNAQEARRVLDRLFGYEVSPVLWRKVKPKLSAGRVQSVATRIIVERERARMKFVSAEYWDVTAKLKTRKDTPEPVEVKLIEIDGKRIAVGKDFDENTGKLKNDRVLLGGDDAKALTQALGSAEFTVADVQEKPFTSKPYAPFITSTLQQEAGRKLRYTAQRTMRTAQRLYENGYITYMRTDSTNLSSQAVNASRNQVTELYGADHLPDAPRVYKSKSKNAQEAHEAIRPAGESFRTPKSLEGELENDEWKLYELIWKRTVASQMKDATGTRTTIRVTAPGIDHKTATFSTSGKVIRFAGYLRAYVEGSDDPDAELEDQEKILPQLASADVLDPTAIDPNQHTTLPPSRFSEASLIKEMEELGIGRPSTYAAIIQTIQDRGYVWKKGSALVPTFTAFAVVNLLVTHLPGLVDYNFTAKMEDSLDDIANGIREAAPWLHDFYFGGGAGGASGGSEGSTDDGGSGNGDSVAAVGLHELVDSSGESIDARGVCCIPIGTTDSGELVAVRVGRYGPYVQIADSDQRATVSDEIPPDEVTVKMVLDLLEEAAKGDRVIGNDPETNKPIYIKTGRFGPYVQLGDPELTPKGTVKKGTAPKRASLWPSMSMDSITLEEATMLLSFPREVGICPETNEPITVQDGRFGPFLKSGNETRSLPDHESLASLTLEQAIELLKQPKRRGRTAAAPIAELGEHPQTKLPLVVKSGRYGPYVTDGVVNATVPKGTDPTTVSLEKAVELIAAREQKMLDQGKDPRAEKPKKAAKKPAAKKKKAKKKTAKKKAKKTSKKTSKKTTKSEPVA